MNGGLTGLGRDEGESFIFGWTNPLTWHSWIIRVLYMKLTYREPQTLLFPPLNVNLMFANEHWKTVTLQLGSFIIFTPKICICSRPGSIIMYLHSRIIRSSGGFVKEQTRTIVKMADHGCKCSRLCRRCEQFSYPSYRTELSTGMGDVDLQQDIAPF